VIKAVGRCLHTLSHILWLVFLSIAVNFIPNKWSPALSLSIDCPMLFSILGLQECSQLLESPEDGTTFVIKAVGRLVFCSCRFIVSVEEL
jgi:hypothetical protein